MEPLGYFRRVGRPKKSLRENLTNRLGRTLNEMLLAVAPEELVAMQHAVVEESRRQGLLYEAADGTLQVIPLLLRPRILSREQGRFFQKVCLEMVHALERLYFLWSTEQAVRALLPLTEGELRWFSTMPKVAARAPQTIFGRLDVQVDFADDDWEAHCHFFEANTVGAGGIHYTPVADQIILGSVMKKLRKLAPGFLIKPADDPRLLLLHTLTHHADEMGLPSLRVGLLQDRRLAGGPEEFPAIARFLGAHDLAAAVVDPRDLVVKRDQLYAGDQPIDLVYRDTTMADLVEYENEGSDLSAMKWAFAHNRVVSSIAGEFDHKSAFEILSDPRFHPHFSAAQRKIFQKYVPWTRTVRETKTSGFDGSELDLVPFVRKNREGLVLKPNRGLGGEKVVIGPFAELDEWDQAIAHAVAHPGETVVQRYVPSLVKDFPVLGEDGRCRLEELYCVCGFFATADGLAILGRASKKRVVNVAQKGGLVACMVLM
ncbi:MAG: hypothetical protein ACOZIN_16985 [Myxococcota bacterium]